jgi:uncharacterized protein (DUF4213/DUF364 family)
MTSSQLSNFYQKLIENVSEEAVTNIYFSDKWCFVQTKSSAGFAMMCPSHHQTELEYLKKKQSLRELATEISSFNFGHASIAMAAINCHYNSRNQINKNYPDVNVPSLIDLPNLISEKYAHKKVVSIGSFAFLKRLNLKYLTIIEKNPKSNEYPDTASEYLIQDAQVVLMTGATLINKSFERLAQIAQEKQVFLIGPSVPFIPDFYSQNISLFGYTILQSQEFIQLLQQGLGKKILSSNSLSRLDYIA